MRDSTYGCAFARRAGRRESPRFSRMCDLGATSSRDQGPGYLGGRAGDGPFLAAISSPRRSLA